MPEDFLTKIVQEKKTFIQKQKKIVPQGLLQKKSQEPHLKRLFKEALVKPGRISLIAEIKQASPSKGIIKKDLNPVDTAIVYQKAGADALSVLTEETYFKGSLSHIASVREKVELPILRKDFIIDDYQIYESYVAGADAILLISEILSKAQLSEFLSLSRTLDMDCLVEAGGEEELEKVLKTETQIIGINNRNLRSFEVDLETSKMLIPLIPKGKIIVSESGIKDANDVNSLKDLGVNAVLIGEAFLRADDIAVKIRQLFKIK
ncbi:MAG: indole-3-glycerol phosphate synthase TrpC [Candidatus Omnitrophota bacterium]